jgi:hypothetical protein
MSYIIHYLQSFILVEARDGFFSVGDSSKYDIVKRQVDTSFRTVYQMPNR